VSLASEQEVGRLFPDCELGAIPAIGWAYGLDVIVDDRLATQGEIWFEAGDHRSLIEVGGDQFRRLLEAAPHGVFSIHD
jgi:Ala-tRNA(Pro) deacylase